MDDEQHGHPDDLRELDARTLDDGTEVRLLWRPVSDRVAEVVLEARMGGDVVRVAVPADRALDAMEHPWLHLPRRTAAAGRG